MAKVMNPVNYVIGQNSAMWLDKATDSEAKVKGLQGMGLGLGFTQSAQTVVMMGERIAPKVFTGAEYEEMTANANYIPGDPTQERLYQAALGSELIKNIRMYLKDKCNFSAPDQIAAGGGLFSGTSGMNVGSYTDPKIDSPTDIYTNSVSFAPGGVFAVFVAHTEIDGGSQITVSGGGGVDDITLTTTGTSWVDLGFEEKDTIIVDWDGSVPERPKYASVKSISDKEMVLYKGVGDADTITIGNLPSKAQIHGATSLDVSNLSTSC